MTPQIRPYKPEDFEPVTRLWRVAREVSLPEFQADKGHTFDEDQAYFREHILPNNDVWVAEIDGKPAAFMAIKEDMIDQLFVRPDFQGKGIGRMLLDFARQLSPSGLRLYTLQINVRAREFYEKNGFVVTALGISPEPEAEPDVLYGWKP